MITGNEVLLLIFSGKSFRTISGAANKIFTGKNARKISKISNTILV